MGRRPKPSGRIRIPLKTYQRIEARAVERGHDTNVEAEELLCWALDNKDKLSTVHMLGDIEPLLEDYARLKGKQRRK